MKGGKKDKPHRGVDVGCACQHPRLEADFGVYFKIVSIGIFTANATSDPRVGGGVEEVAGGILEVGDAPDVFEIWELSFGEAWAEELLEAVIVSHGCCWVGKKMLPSVGLVNKRTSSKRGRDEKC